MRAEAGGVGWLDAVLAGWFVLALLSTICVAGHALTKNRDLAVTKWGWVLVTLYTGPIGAVLYALSYGRRRPTSPRALVEPIWKQALGSTMHCVAGDATGVIVAAAFASALGLPMWLDLAVEYVLGLGSGLFVFQALAMKGLGGHSYVRAVRRSVLPAWLAMNAMMAGMIPTMVILMSRDPAAMDPTAAHFWGVMSLATLAGAVAAYPLNLWLVAMHHGRPLGAPLHGGSRGETGVAELRDRGRAGHHRNGDVVAPIVARRLQLAAMSVLSLLALASGVLLASVGGDLRMRTGSREATAGSSAMDVIDLAD